MFMHTRAVGKKVMGELRFYSTILAFLLQFLYIGFLVFSLATGRGSMTVNTILLCVTIAFFTFLLYSAIAGEFLSKKEARRMKHIFRLLLLFFRAFSLYVTIYGIYVALADINPTAMIFAAFMFVAWVIGALFEVVRFILERYTALMTTAIIKDTDPMVNFYNKITFKHTEPREETKTDAYVEDITAEYAEELRVKKGSRKARAEAERLIRRETRREALHNLASGAKSKIKSFFTDSEEDETDKKD